MARFVADLIDLRLYRTQVAVDLAALFMNPPIVGMLETIVHVALDPPDLDDCVVGLTHAIANPQCELKTLTQLRNRHVLHARIDRDLEVLRLRLTVGGQANLIAARDGGRSVIAGCPENTSFEIRVARIPEVPTEAMGSGQFRRLTSATASEEPEPSLWFRTILLLAFVCPDHLSVRVEEFHREFFRIFGEVVVHLHAVIHAAHRIYRLEEMHVGAGHLLVELAQRGHVEHHPERTSVGRDHEVVLFNDQIRHLGNRQVERQGLPVGAVVPRHIHRTL